MNMLTQDSETWSLPLLNTRISLPTKLFKSQHFTIDKNSVPNNIMGDQCEPTISFKCNICEVSSNLKRCSRCKSVFYCCREHQISDWNVHKTTCNPKRELVSVIANEGSGDGLNSGSGKHNEDGVEFDKRTFKPLVFKKPKSRNFQDVAGFVYKMLQRNGHCVVDSLFELSHLGDVMKEVHTLEFSGELQPGKLAGGITSGIDNEKVVNHNIRSDKLKWLEGNEKEYPNICRVLQTMDTIMACLNSFLNPDNNINRRTKAMVATYQGNGAYYRRHVDNPKKDGRLITCILYLNNDWNVQTDGGLLRIFPSGSNEYVDVPPLFNRLLFFWSDRRNPHEVQPAYKNRYAVTVWYFDEKERKEIEENQDQIDKSIRETYGNLALLEIETKKMEKKEIQSKIEDETQKVINSLSEEELDAISALLKGQSNPKAVLHSLGISPAIQDKLIDVIKENTLRKS